MKIKKVQTRSVACDGTNDGATLSSGHPKIYLQITAATNQVTCVYCGQVFEYVGDDA